MWMLSTLSAILFLNCAFTDGCQFPISDGKCLFVEFRSEQGFRYSQAERFCESAGGAVGVIPDEGTYEELVSFIQSVIPDDLDVVQLWTGVEVDPLTGQVTEPENAFTHWNPLEGLATGASVSKWTQVYMTVSRFEDDESQGMSNYKPKGRLDGVLCETAT